MDLISLIVPVYNVEKYFVRCIKSILKQTYSNIEVILVDDGSDDNSGELCDEYAKVDNRIKVIHKKNEGLGYARNSGLDIASGKYVTFIDSDDYIGENHIQSLYSLLIQTKSDTCMGGYTKVYPLFSIEHKQVCAGNVFINNVKAEIIPRMCGADKKGTDYIEMSVCMVLFSNDIIRKNNIRFVSERRMISEDLVFDFEYYSLSERVCVSDITDYFYCDNQGSLTTKYRKDRFDCEVDLFKYLSARAKTLEILDLCLPRLQNTLISIARYSIKLEYKFSDINGKEKVQNNIQHICNNAILEEAMKDYDDKYIKKSSRLVNFMIKRKMYLALCLTMKLKNALNI